MDGWMEGRWVDGGREGGWMYVRTDDSDLLEFLHNKSTPSVFALLLLHLLPIFQGTLAFQLDDSDKHKLNLLASDKIKALFQLLPIF